jgi:hypothetical protein
MKGGTEQNKSTSYLPGEAMALYPNYDYRVETWIRKRPGSEKYGIIGSVLRWLVPVFFCESLRGIVNNPSYSKSPIQIVG